MASVDDIQTRIEQITGRDDKSTRIQTRILGAINEIQRRNNHYFMEEAESIDLVADQQTYVFADELTATYKDLRNIWLLDSDGAWNEDPLEKITMEEARQRWSYDDEGDPEAYSIFKETIYVWPPEPQDADKDLHVEFYKYLDVLEFAQSPTEDSNELTTRWDDLIEAWATWKFYTELPGDSAGEEAKRWMSIALSFYEELIKYSNTIRLKDKGVMKVRTSPRQVDKSRRLPFGGR